MKLQVTQANLSKALNTVARIANSRGTLPVLANVLIKTQNNRLSIAATNLDLAITHFIGSKIQSEGAITVPARLMQDFISNLPESVINLGVSDNKLSITTDQYNSVINGIPAEDFPVMPAIKGGSTWKLPVAEFKKALSKTVFAASSDDSRPVLTGVYFNTYENKVAFAATDSYRLAECQAGKTSTEIEFLLPASAANDLLRIINDEDKEVSIIHDNQQVSFEFGDVSLVARLIEGSYPDYKKLIPSKFTTIASLKKADFLNIA